MSAATKDGGPAFPSANAVRLGDVMTNGHPGLSLRDYFAAKAVSAIAHRVDLGERDAGYLPSTAARLAYEIADAMLKARAQ